MKKQEKAKAEGGRRKAEDEKIASAKKRFADLREYKEIEKNVAARALALPTLPAASDGKGKGRAAGKSSPKPLSGGDRPVPPGLRALLVPIGQLHPDPENARRHDERGNAAIMASLERFGQQAPVVYTIRKGKKIVIKGNGVLAAGKALGWRQLAAVQSGLKEREAMAYAIADNRTTDLSEFDEKLLAAQLAELELNSFDLEAVGFTDAEYQDLLEQVAAMGGGGEGGEGDGGETASRKRGERTALVIVGHLKFEMPRVAFDRWLAAVEAKVGNDPDRVVAEIKRRLKLGSQ